MTDLRTNPALSAMHLPNATYVLESFIKQMKGFGPQGMQDNELPKENSSFSRMLMIISMSISFD